MVKNPPANAGDSGEGGWIAQSRRPPGEGNGNPLQYSSLRKIPGTQDPGGCSPGSWTRLRDYIFPFFLCVGKRAGKGRYMGLRDLGPCPSVCLLTRPHPEYK